MLPGESRGPKGWRGVAWAPAFAGDQVAHAAASTRPVPVSP